MSFTLPHDDGGGDGSLLCDYSFHPLEKLEVLGIGEAVSDDGGFKGYEGQIVSEGVGNCLRVGYRNADLLVHE